MSKNKELFITFMKIGAFTFGGGYAMIPLIKRDVVDNKKWISEDEMVDIVAVAESTPGPMAVNTATFVGSKVSGTFGAFLATLGVVLPSFVIMLIVSFVLDKIEGMQIIKHAFFGIRCAVLVLILFAFISMFRKCKKGFLTYVIMIGGFVATTIFNVGAILILVSAALIGIVVSEVRKQ